MRIRPLRRWPLVLVIVGLIWFFQGIGVLPGSFMSGDRTWAFIGGAMVLTGALLLLRRSRRARDGDRQTPVAERIAAAQSLRQ